MATTYGTISTDPPPSDSPFLSSARQRIRSGVGTRRPWKEMFTSLSLPESLSAALHRLRANASYFHVNYAIIILFTLFVSLLWHPVSLIVFIVLMAAWLFLYFLRDDPVVVCGYGVEERVVLVGLSILTVVAMMLTRASVFAAGVAVGVAAVATHGAVRRTNDLGFDVEGSSSERVVDLKETASASYSTSNL